MFQEKERVEYLNEHAPEELKNRTWSSIQKRGKQRRQGLVMAACFAGVLLVSNFMYQNSMIVKIHDAENSPFTISEKRNEETPDEISMEINVKGRACVEVSHGSIRTEGDSETLEDEVKKLDVEGKTVVVWTLDGDSNIIATCTVTTEEAQYQYLMEKKESGWKLKLKGKN